MDYDNFSVLYFNNRVIMPSIQLFLGQALRRMQRVGIRLNVAAYTVAIKVGH
jgi:hypothetical protein